MWYNILKINKEFGGAAELAAAGMIMTTAGINSLFFNLFKGGELRWANWNQWLQTALMPFGARSSARKRQSKNGLNFWVRQRWLAWFEKQFRNVCGSCFGNITAVSSERSLTCMKIPDDDGQLYDEECNWGFTARCLSFQNSQLNIGLSGTNEGSRRSRLQADATVWHTGVAWKTVREKVSD